MQKATPRYVQMATRQSLFNFSNPSFGNLSKAQFLGGNAFEVSPKDNDRIQFDLTAAIACGRLMRRVCANSSDIILESPGVPGVM